MAKRFDVHRLRDAVSTARSARGLSMSATASQAGVAHSTIRRLEKGQAPSCDGYLAICTWLGVSADEFRTDAAPVSAVPPLINEAALRGLSSTKARALGALAEAAAAIVADGDDDTTDVSILTPLV